MLQGQWVRYFLLTLAIASTTEYGVNFTVGKDPYAACVELTATLVPSVPGRCINGGVSSVSYSVSEDWLRLRVALDVLSVTTGGNITQIQAYTASVVGSTVTVVDRAPDELSAGQSKFYLSAASELPRALFGRVQELPTTLDFVQFFDLSIDYDGDIGSWSWDFGDGSPLSTLRNPAKRFSEPCTLDERGSGCTVVLQVTDNEGNLGREFEDFVLIRYVPEAT